MAEPLNILHATNNNNKAPASAINIKITHWNANSIKNKVDLLKHYISHSSPLVLSLNEIKCDRNYANYCLNIPSYNSIVKPRNNFGGGVALLIHESIKFKEIDLSNKTEEIVGVEINLEGIKLQVFSYYNPPD